MQFYKIAQGEDKVKIEFTVNKETGEWYFHVLGHTGKLTCAAGLDAALIEKLIKTPIPGWGSLGVIVRTGKTEEGFEPTLTSAPMVHQEDLNENKNDAFSDDFGVFDNSSTKSPDQLLGFGV